MGLNFPRALALCLMLASPKIWARGGGGCLVEGSLVGTPQGSIAVEAIENKTEIRSLHGSLHPLDEISFEASEWIEIVLPSTHLRLTKDHPLFVSKSTLKAAGDLAVGDFLLKEDGQTEPILEVRPHQDKVQVYNLVLPAPGIFSVQGFLTHNKGCFVPDTQIWMADGSQKAISQIQPGDQVLGFDSNEQTVRTSVEKVYTAQSDFIFEITLENNQKVRATAEHPFYTGHGEFRLVESLQPGDEIKILLKEGLATQKIQSISKIYQPSTVYNLMTSQPHTFFAAQIAVHNKGGGGGGGRGVGGSYRSRTCYDNNGHVISCPFSFIDQGFTILVLFLSLFGLALGTSGKKKSSDELDHIFSPGDYTDRADLTESTIENLIAKNDPKFELKNCRQIATKAFLTLQKVWQDRDYTEMKSLVFEELAEQHLLQIQSMIRNHEIDRIENIQIQFIRFVDFQKLKDPNHDTFTVLIQASAKDYYVDDRTLKFLRGDSSQQNFQEFWIFQWQDSKWLLREIQQTRESEVLSRPLPSAENPAMHQPAIAPASTYRSKLEQQAFELSKSDPIWQPEKLHSLARVRASEFLMSFESLSMEKLNSKLTDRFYAEVMKDIEQLLRDQGKWEFRNLCLRNSELIALERNGRFGSRFAVRLTFHAQRTQIQKGQTLREDSFVTSFEMEAWFQKVENAFLLDDMKMKA